MPKVTVPGVRSPNQPSPATKAPTVKDVAPAPGPAASTKSAGWAAGAGQGRFVVPTSIGAPVLPQQSNAPGPSIGFMSDAALRAAPKEQKLELLKSLLSQLGTAPNYEQVENMRGAVTQLILGTKNAGELDYLLTRVKAGDVKFNISGADRTKALKHIEELGKTTPGDWSSYRGYLEEVTGAKSSGKNSLDFLVDGTEFSPKALEVFSGAKHSINLSVFQLQADAVGQKVIDLLCERARAGVKVRVMVDELGTMKAGGAKAEAMFAQLRAAGGEVVVKKTPVLVDHLDHRKVFLIDGQQAFTGGMNLGHHYQEEWHDQQTLVRGPAVNELQQAFFEHWAREGGLVPEGAELKKYFNADGEFDSGAETYVVKHQGGHQDQNIKAAYLRAFATAQKSITLASPYFSDAEVVAELCKAAKRGVRVQVILPAENNQNIVKQAARGFYPDLIKAGVEVYEYQGRMAHQKVGLIDDMWATVGSSNLDARSLRFNDEMNLVTFGPEFAGQIRREMFDVDLKQSRRITEVSVGVEEKFHRLISPWI